MLPDAPTNRQLGEALRRLRCDGRTAAEVGSRAGLPPGFLAKAERGEACLSAAELCRVLVALEADFLMLHVAIHGKSRGETLAMAFIAERLLGKVAG